MNTIIHQMDKILFDIDYALYIYDEIIKVLNEYTQLKYSYEIIDIHKELRKHFNENDIKIFMICVYLNLTLIGINFKNIIKKYNTYIKDYDEDKNKFITRVKFTIDNYNYSINFKYSDAKIKIINYFKMMWKEYYKYEDVYIR